MKDRARTVKDVDGGDDPFVWLCESFGEALADVDIGVLDVDGLAALIRALRSVQAQVDGLLVQAGVQADRLAADGAGIPARDAFIGSGEVRGHTARGEAARSKLAGRVPALGVVMGSGRVGPDHLDALVRRLGRLADDHLARIDIDAVVARAGCPADTFDAALRQLVADAAVAPDIGPETDPLLAEAEQARADSEVRHWFDHKTGMGHITGRFDAERYEALANAIDQHTASLANRLNRNNGDGSGRDIRKDANWRRLRCMT